MNEEQIIVLHDQLKHGLFEASENASSSLAGAVHCLFLGGIVSVGAEGQRIHVANRDAVSKQQFGFTHERNGLLKFIRLSAPVRS